MYGRGVVGVELGGDHLQGFSAEGTPCNENAGREEHGARKQEGKLPAEPDRLGDGCRSTWASSAGG